MLRRARRLACVHSPLVPAKGLRDRLDKQDELALVRERRAEAQLKPQVLPPKKYRPLSLKAREDIMTQRSADFEHIVVDDESFGQRLDEFVLAKYPHLNYGQLRDMVQRGELYRYRHNAKRRYTKLTDRLERGELVVVPPSVRAQADSVAALNVNRDGLQEPEIISETTSEIGPDGKPKRHVSLSAKVREEAYKWVLFKNKHVIVINKPSGVPMNGGSGVKLNVHDMLPAWKFSNPSAPLLVHRLDQDTSGIVLLARSHDAQRMLGRMFVRRAVPNSVYWGFLVGKPAAKFGRIRMHLEIDKAKGGTQIVARTTSTDKSRAAIAEYVVNAGALEYGSFVSFYPLTSQTSQLRIMAAHALGCPVLGDGRFGGETAFPQNLSSFFDPEEKGVPLHLHHRKVQLPYKNSRGEFETVSAPLPAHMQDTFRKLGWPVNVDDPLIPG
jgi:23S rRNA pseudouridine955/2504/2580 synthase